MAKEPSLGGHDGGGGGSYPTSVMQSVYSIFQADREVNVSDGIPLVVIINNFDMKVKSIEERHEVTIPV